MWEWLRDNNMSDKMAFFTSFEEDHFDIRREIPLYQCYACEFTSKTKKDVPSCNYCPIIWVEDQKYIKDDLVFCEFKESVYYEWLFDRTEKTAQKVIDIIKETWEE